ncbi:Eukaryotic aspartyl protease [Phytophthora infestans]|uniref:Eukaryotic aspartyl protease n=1 Tax=Phytophthora infestans TaxID=4787 RepID=A0A833T484_PHYIN|nr:Eukaryotic aspartyl protease [Phytophthora infestans]
MTSRCAASGVPWLPVAFLAAIAVVVCSLVSATVASEQSFLKIRLHKQQQQSSELSHRLAHQQARAHRRAQEVVGNSSGNSTRGALALSEAPLGVGYGTHYAEIHLGIPAQRASVIVDTGSHLTALPCSTCNGCGTHTDPLFDVSKSTTAKYLGCHDFDSCRSCENDRCIISQSYMEGSMWHAIMVDELVWVGGFSTPSDEMEGILKTFGFRFPVGCQTKETGLFITQKENGIMGLGRHRSTVMSYMLNAGRVTQNLFTLCFAGDGGELVFGGVDYSHHTSDVGYTPLLDDKSAYYPVHVKDIRMNGVSLGIDAGTINSGRGVIVDSGTTDTFFDSKGSRAFMKAFQNAAGREYSEKRMDLTADELAALPTISIILSGMKGDGTDDIQLDIPASSYLTPSDKVGSYNGNFHFSERSGGVLGASTMIGFDVIFDTENKRVGFAESDCGKSYANTSTQTPIASNSTGQPIPQTEAPAASNTTTLGRNTTQQPVSTTASSSSSSNNSSVESNTTTAALVDVTDSVDVSTSSSTGATTRRASPKFGAFVAEVILISLVGVALGVMVWTKWRTRSWSRIPNATETSRAHMETVVDMNDNRSLSPTSPPGSPLSPRSRAARKGQSPKFTIGSPVDEEDADKFREEEEG